MTHFEPNIASAVTPASRSDATAEPSPDRAVAARVEQLDVPSLQQDFVQQGSFLSLDTFLPANITARLIADTHLLQENINRNYLPGHKQGGSVSRHTIDTHAPFIAELYRSPALIDFLERLTGDKLLLSPDDDPHAYALYYYTRPGDHIGWHYDTSYYEGRRYTLLFGVIDQSTCRLDYELHTRNPDVRNVAGSIQIQPGGIVLFDGDTLRHRVTPLGNHEMRVSLTFEYVTNANMRPWKRMLSNLKDAIAYFGFRQLFKTRSSHRTHS